MMTSKWKELYFKWANDWHLITLVSILFSLNRNWHHMNVVFFPKRSGTKQQNKELIFANSPTEREKTFFILEYQNLKLRKTSNLCLKKYANFSLEWIRRITWKVRPYKIHTFILFTVHCSHAHGHSVEPSIYLQHIFQSRTEIESRAQWKRAHFDMRPGIFITLNAYTSIFRLKYLSHLSTILTIHKQYFSEIRSGSEWNCLSKIFHLVKCKYAYNNILYSYILFENSCYCWFCDHIGIWAHPSM